MCVTLAHCIREVMNNGEHTLAQFGFRLGGMITVWKPCESGRPGWVSVTRVMTLSVALRHKYQVEGVKLPAWEPRQQRRSHSQSLLSESGFDWQVSVVVEEPAAV